MKRTFPSLPERLNRFSRNQIIKKSLGNDSRGIYCRHQFVKSALAELRRTTGSLQTVFLKVSGSKILYLSRFLRVMPLGCPLGCPREAPVLVWCLFPLGFYNIAQDDCFFKRQEEEPILFGSSTGYSAFAYMLLKALFTMVDSASGLLYFTLAYMSIVILLFS